MLTRRVDALPLRRCAQGLVVLAVLVGAALRQEAALPALRRLGADASLSARRWWAGADAAGWTPCSAQCGWGTQSRQLDSCSCTETRPCWGPGEVGCDGVCGSGKGLDCQGVCGGRARMDDCGVCNGNNKDKDCAGVCFGNTPTDCAGTCAGVAGACAFAPQRGPNRVRVHACAPSRGPAQHARARR